MRRPLPLLLALLLAPAPVAADGAWEVEGRITAGPAYDTNVRRRSGGAGVVADEGLFLLGGVELRWRQDDAHLTTLGWEGGTRVFEAVTAENQFAHQLTLGHLVEVAPGVVAGAEVRRRDLLLRAGDRDAAETGGHLSLQWQPSRLLAPRLRVGFRRTDWWPDARWSGEGPWAGLSLGLRPWARHLGQVGWEVHQRTYPDRQELVHQGHLGWTWRSRLVLSGGYLFSTSSSDLPGFASVRHRFHALLGAPLPASLLLNVQATLQLVRFPEGIRFSDELLFARDDENLSSLAVLLSRQLSESFSLEGRYQLYLASVRRAGIDYERHVFATALTWRFDN